LLAEITQTGQPRISFLETIDICFFALLSFFFFSPTPCISTLTFTDNKDIIIDWLNLLPLPFLHFWSDESQITLEFIALKFMNGIN